MAQRRKHEVDLPQSGTPDPKEHTSGAAVLHPPPVDEATKRNAFESVRPTNEHKARQRPHVHVMGDLAVLHLYRWFERLPDHDDPALSSYRKLKGFVRRAVAGGAWSVAQCVRAALGDVWKCNTTCFAFIDAIETADSESWVSGVLETLDGPIQRHSYYEHGWRFAQNELAYPGADSEENHGLERVAITNYPDPDLTYFDFQEGVASATVRQPAPVIKTPEPHETGDESTDSPLLAEFKMNDTWSPSMSIWPQHDLVRVAIRQINLRELLLHARDNGPPTVEAIWSMLMPDEERPLRSFLELSDAELANEQQNGTDTIVPQFSRAVLLLDKAWCDQESGNKPSQRRDLSERGTVGWFIFRTDLDAWHAWSASSEVKLSFDHPDIDSLVDVSAYTPRLLFKFANTGQNFPNNLFGIPIPASIARLFKPSVRPAPEFAAPLAVVTTSEKSTYDEDDRERSADVIRPMWRVDKIDDPTPVFRLTEARGYEWTGDLMADVERAYARQEKNSSRDRCGEKETPEQQSLRLSEWGLSRFFRHGEFTPQWAPKDVVSNEREFQHLVFTDLNFGFRRFSGATFSELATETTTTFSTASKASERPQQFIKEIRSLFGDQEVRSFSDEQEQSEGPTTPKIDIEQKGASDKSEADEPIDDDRPDWWLPLGKWLGPIAETLNTAAEMDDAKLADRGWIVAILGRQLPLRETDYCDGCDCWDEGDLWHLLRKAENEYVESRSKRRFTRPIFRDRTIAIVSGNLLRASGARISHRLSWEHTAVDCVRELQKNPKFSPLLEFRHLLIRFGCSAAIHMARYESLPPHNNETRSQYLFFDATAKNGFHRDPGRGHVVGANSVFAALLLKELIGKDGCNVNTPSEEESRIHRGISQAILDCQLFYDNGYGSHVDEQNDYRIDYGAPEKILFRPIKP